MSSRERGDPVATVSQTSDTWRLRVYWVPAFASTTAAGTSPQLLIGIPDSSMIAYWTSIAALLIAIVGCGYLLAATVLVGRFACAQALGAPATTPAVTILKPLHGDDAGLFENLMSFAEQHYAGAVQIVCGVADAHDPAVAVVERLRGSLATRDLDLIIDATLHGTNRKVSNLINMAPRIRHDIVVISDSDIRVEPDYLARVIAALQQPRVGAVTCLYHGVAAGGPWSQLGALFINAHFLPSVVLGLASGMAQPCFGSTIALKRSTLDAIGGLAAFADRLDDDYAIGAAARERGDTVAIPPLTVAHFCSEPSLRELWRHELRWARTIRNIAPLGHAGSVVMHPLAWAVVALALSPWSGLLLPAIAATVAAILCRVVLLHRVARGFGLPPQPYWLVPVRDLLLFAVFVASFLGRDVSWRGHRYRLIARKAAGVSRQ
jgi:ceramide glucosyltransferase